MELSCTCGVDGRSFFRSKVAEAMKVIVVVCVRGRELKMKTRDPNVGLDRGSQEGKFHFDNVEFVQASC